MWTVVLLTAGLRPLPALAQVDAGTLTADFDYTVDARFGDRDNDGMLLSFENVSVPDGFESGYISKSITQEPPSLPVHFDACAANPPGAVNRYVWTVNDWTREEATRLQTEQHVLCGSFTYDFSREGTYVVTLTVEDTAGNAESITKLVVVQDWFIVGIGDSYASGEGAPDVVIPQASWTGVEAEWQAFQEVEWNYNDTLTRLDQLATVLGYWELSCSELTAGECADCVADCASDALTPTLTPCETNACLDCCAHFTVKLGVVAALVGYKGTIDTVQNIWNQARQFWEVSNAAFLDAGASVIRALNGVAFATWQEEQCHRSGRSHQVLAAERIEDADPSTSVTFVHAACTAAVVARGDDALNSARGQLAAVKALFPDREIDALLVSAGGNTVGFFPVMLSCIIHENCSAEETIIDPGIEFTIDKWCFGSQWFSSSCREELLDDNKPESSGLTTWTGRVQRVTYNGGTPDTCSGGFNHGAACDESLGNADCRDGSNNGICTRNEYYDLQNEIDGHIPPQRVYLTEYPAATRNAQGLCAAITVPGVSATEMIWAHGLTGGAPGFTGLNELMETNAEGFGWRFVEGIADRFRDHGYCGNEVWFNGLVESLWQQKDRRGFMHPNAAGQADGYTLPVYLALENDMYVPGPRGIQVRTPRQEPLAWIEKEYVVDEGSYLRLRHQSFDPNGEPIKSYAWRLSTDLFFGLVAPTLTPVGWGDNRQEQTSITEGTYFAIAAGYYHSLAIRPDGTLAAWGRDDEGQIPPSNSGTFVAVAAGRNHSLAIRSDRRLSAWGSNTSGQTDVPAGADFIAITAGGFHNLAIHADGTLEAWGSNTYGQADAPTGTFLAVASGQRHNIAIRSDGTLAGWGWNDDGQTLVPAGTFIAVSAGDRHSLAIRSDGTLVGWGRNVEGQTDVPAGTFVEVEAGGNFSIAIRSDGTLAAWGANGFGQTSFSEGPFTTVAAGFYHSLAIRVDPPADPADWSQGLNAWVDPSAEFPLLIGVDDGDGTVTLTMESDPDAENDSNHASARIIVNNVDPLITQANGATSTEDGMTVFAGVLEAIDVAADDLEVTTEWSDDGTKFAPGLPNGVAVVENGCIIAGITKSCSWVLSGAAQVAVGTYFVRVTVTDDDAGSDDALMSFEVTCDGTGLVGAAALVSFVSCLEGPGAGRGTQCECVDLDSDGDITMADFAKLQRNYTGN